VYLTTQVKAPKMSQSTLPNVPGPLLENDTVPAGAPAGPVTFAVQIVTPLVRTDEGEHWSERPVGASCVKVLVAVVVDNCVAVIVAVAVVAVVIIEVAVVMDICVVV
jgi:hypothetical protein